MAAHCQRSKKLHVYLQQKEVEKTRRNPQEGTYENDDQFSDGTYENDDHFSCGTYENVSRFVDIQFRLLKERVFTSFRKGIQEYRDIRSRTNEMINLETGKVYSGEVRKKTIKLLKEIYIIMLPTNSENPHDFSRYLRPGDIICMSYNEFEKFIFAQVICCEGPPYLNRFCKLEIMVENMSFEAHMKTGCHYRLLATNTCRQFHIQTLKRLKSVSEEDFPLKNSLLHLESCDKLPPYWPTTELTKVKCGKRNLKDKKSVHQRFLSSLETVEKQYGLDAQQVVAFKLALTNQVSVTEGPPGSGKTFLCTVLMHWLLSEAKTYFKSPILFLCKTESCLDRQMECVLSYTDKIVRVGGQCTSEKLDQHKLYNLGKFGFEKNELNGCSSGTVCRNEVVEPSQPSSRSIAVGMSSRNENKRVLFRKKAANLKDRPLARSLDSLKTNGTSLKWNEELLLDDADEIKDIEYNVLAQSEHKLNQLNAIIIKVYLSPLSNTDIVKQIVPENMCRNLLTKSSKTTANMQAEEIKTNLQYAVIEWLCLTPKDIDSLKNTDFVKEVLLSYQREFSSCRGETVDLKSGKAAQKQKELLKDIFSPKAETFQIIEKAALKYLSIEKGREITSRLYCDVVSQGVVTGHPWNLTLLERFQLFAKWRQAALKRLNNQMCNIMNTYKKQKELETIEIMKCSLACCVEADIVGMTFSWATRHPQFLKEIAPAVIISDESDELLDGELVASLPTTVQHFVSVGNARCATTYKNYDRSLFGRLHKYGAPCGMLKTQHRIKPQIAELLITEEHTGYSSDVLTLADIKGVSSNVFFVDHKVEPEIDDSGVCSSRMHEAKFLLCLLNYLSKVNDAATEIKLLVTDTDQLNIIKELSQKSDLSVSVSQINELRGKETDIVLLSLANKVSNDPKQVFNDIFWSITRCRKGFFCIGNFELPAKKCSLLGNFIQNMKSKLCCADALFLKCINHPQILTPVSSFKDFKSFKSSGCSKNCSNTEADHELLPTSRK